MRASGGDGVGHGGGGGGGGGNRSQQASHQWQCCSRSITGPGPLGPVSKWSLRPDLLLKLRNLELVSLTCLSLRLSSKSCLKLHLETGPWSVMGSPGSASGQVNQVVIQYLSFSQNSPSSQKQGFYSGGKAQRRHLVADASKLRRTEGDSLFPFAKITWTQLPASQTKR